MKVWKEDKAMRQERVFSPPLRPAEHPNPSIQNLMSVNGVYHGKKGGMNDEEMLNMW